MNKKVTIFQKPTCNKCQTTLGILKELGVEYEAINYYEKPLDAEQLRELLVKLKLSASDLLRKDELIAQNLKLEERSLSDADLIQVMVENPDLIQRPIVVCGDKAVLGRPPENVRKLF